MDCPEVEALETPPRPPTAHPGRAVAACRDEVAAAGADPAALTPARLGPGPARRDDRPRRPPMGGDGSRHDRGGRMSGGHRPLRPGRGVDSRLGRSRPAGRHRRRDGEVARACRADGYCSRNLRRPRTVRGTGRGPASGPARSRSTCSGSTVIIDADTLVRAGRWVSAPAILGPGRLPALLAEAARGKAGPLLTAFAQTLSVAPPLCLGFVPKCYTEQRLVLGATLSRDVSDHCGLRGLVSGVPGVGDRCRDPSGSAADRRPDARPLRRARPVRRAGVHPDPPGPARPGRLLPEQSSGGHNVLGSECPREVRNAWLAGDLQAPPPSVPCMSDPIDFHS